MTFEIEKKNKESDPVQIDDLVEAWKNQNLPKIREILGKISDNLKDQVERYLGVDFELK